MDVQIPFLDRGNPVTNLHATGWSDWNFLNDAHLPPYINASIDKQSLNPHGEPHMDNDTKQDSCIANFYGSGAETNTHLQTFKEFNAVHESADSHKELSQDQNTKQDSCIASVYGTDYEDETSALNESDGEKRVTTGPYTGWTAPELECSIHWTRGKIRDLENGAITCTIEHAASIPWSEMDRDELEARIYYLQNQLDLLEIRAEMIRIKKVYEKRMAIMSRAEALEEENGDGDYAARPRRGKVAKFRGKKRKTKNGIQRAEQSEHAMMVFREDGQAGSGKASHITSGIGLVGIPS